MPRADAVRNRGRLLTAAAELFHERGVDVPLEDVARHAGVSIGTLYNHFPHRGALIDAVLPEQLAELDRLAAAAAADPDPWRGFTGFLEGMFALQARDRGINDVIARNPLGDVGLVAECGQSGGVVEGIVLRAGLAGVLRPDFGPADLATLVQAMAHVIAASPGDDGRWRRHLAFFLDGVRSPTGNPSHERVSPR